MKKNIILFALLTLLIPISAFSQTKVVYRLSSGEVVRITTGSTHNEESRFGFDLVTDPSFSDGQQWLDPNYDYRVVGYAKIYSGGVVRNATQNEIDTFAAAAVDDRNKREADRAIDYFQNDPKFRRAMIAIIKGIIKEDNEGRLWTRSFMAAVAASTSLANFQSRVAALDTPTDREFSDAKDYILGQISKDD